MAGFSSLTGGAGGLSASSSAKSGDAGTGAVGISIGGINTGTQTSTAMPQWVWYAALALAAFAILRRR